MSGVRTPGPRRTDDKASDPALPLRARAVLHGPFRVLTDDGRDVTPGGALRQAILAVLVAAPDQRVARRVLQSMFWGDAAAARASANLRTALYLLKQDLEVLGPEIVLSGPHVVGLAPGRLSAVVPQDDAAVFLDGLDLTLADCEPFEDWLRAMRQGAAVDAGPAAVRTPRPAAPILLRGTPRHLALGLMPTVHADAAEEDRIAADGLTDAIARYMAQTTAVAIHDLRGYDTQVLPLPLEGGQGVTHLLQAHLQGAAPARASQVRLRLLDVVTRQVLWQSEPADARLSGGMDSACPASEAILDRMAAHPTATSAPDLYPWTALTALFSLDEALIARVDTQLARMIDAGGPPVLRCLRIFAQVFHANEGFGEITRTDVQSLRTLLAGIPLSDPLLPLCESLLGYAAHMLFGENDLAEMLIESAFQKAPHLSLNLDHLAVLRLMRGDVAGAEAAFALCIKAGAFSPWRYTYEVTGAMIALTRGDTRQTLHFANCALLRKPRFVGALRYSMAGFALADKPQDARRMLTRIRHLRPDYDISNWAETFLRRAPDDLGRSMTASLHRSAIL